MKIALTGVGSTNKGAELMFYAILQEVERKYGNAIFYIEAFSLGAYPISYIKTNQKILYKPYRMFVRLLYRLHLSKIANYLYMAPVKGVDMFIDCSGFYFSDQMNISDREVRDWARQLRYYSEKGVKVIFLPQAFGPVENTNTKLLLQEVSNAASIIFAREKVSYNYLQESGINMDKVQTCTDFTSLVNGVVPNRYKHLEGSVCVIPNNRMIQQKILSLDKYVEMLSLIVSKSKISGRNVFLLIHAEGRDYELAKKCKERLGEDVEVVNGLNALEVKGMISISYLCVSSRFHGVASSLNTCVPCLATSWSHKYKELFADYGLSDCILPIDDNEKMLSMVEMYLGTDVNDAVRHQLKEVKPLIQQKAKYMWNIVWNSKNCKI